MKVCSSGYMDHNDDEYARGNVFARGHDLMSKNKYFQKTPFLFKKTPTVLLDSPFYPLKDNWVLKHPRAITYPHPKQFVAGYPIYKYPYTLKNEQAETGYIETFSNNEVKKYSAYGLIALLGLFLLK